MTDFKERTPFQLWKGMPEASNDQPENQQPKFPLGQTVITRAALAALSASDVSQALNRHWGGDWGDVDPEDWQANEDSLKHGARLVSVYHAADGTKFYVITEHDRSLTTVLLPADY